MAPWYQVHYCEVESYRREGNRTVIGLEGNSTIDLDWKSNRYSVRVNGVEVAKDGDTFCPIGSDRIAFYSLKDGRLTAALPAGWNVAAVAALALCPDRAEEVALSKAGGKLSVDELAGRPIVVFGDGAAARTKVGVNR
jgi:hypothetical protein